MSGRDKIGKLNPYTNVITEYSIPIGSADPRGIAVDNMNRVWFAIRGQNMIVRLDPVDCKFHFFYRTNPGAPMGMAFDRIESKIWFSDEAGARICKVDPDVMKTTTTTNWISSAQTTSFTTVTTSSTTATLTGTTGVSTPGVARIEWTVTSNATSTTVRTSYGASETVEVLKTSTAGYSTSTIMSTRFTTITSTMTSYVQTTTTTFTTTPIVTYTTYVSTVQATATTYLTSTTTFTTSMTSTSTSSQLITTTITTTSTTTTTSTLGMGAAAIPGFPIESIAIGLLFGVASLALFRRFKGSEGIGRWRR
jgi:hypothetical protein